MELVFNTFAVLIGAGAIAFIAFPDFFFRNTNQKKQKVGPVYWGIYEGQSPEEPDSMKTIEVESNSKKEQVIAGSAMYAKGRGTSFRM